MGFRLNSGLGVLSLGIFDPAKLRRHESDEVRALAWLLTELDRLLNYEFKKDSTPRKIILTRCSDYIEQQLFKAYQEWRTGFMADLQTPEDSKE